MISYAQNWEDVLLSRCFHDVDEGFYIDIGAYDPVNGSVTKSFYDRGWRGINVEPGSVFDRLAEARTRDINLRMVVLDRTGSAEFLEDLRDGGMSHVRYAEAESVTGQEIKLSLVPCDTLENIVGAHAADAQVDFLKIDVEGAERAIIATTDWRRFRPRILVIEATRPWTNELNNETWEPILLEQGYVRVYFDGINCFYAREEDPDISAHFNVPVNALDRAQTYDPTREQLENDLQASNVRIQELRDAAHTADTRIQELQDAVDVEKAESNGLRDEASRLRTLLSEAQIKLEATQRELVAVKGESDDLRCRHAEIQAALGALAPQAAQFQRLVHSLRLEGGPRALRIVLPLSRAVRALAQISGLGPRDSGFDSRTLATEEVSYVITSDEKSAMRNNLHNVAARFAKSVYRIAIRPWARPLAWRFRSFLLLGLRPDLAELQRLVQTDLAELQRLVQTLALEAQARPDMNAQLVRSIEIALLTLVLDRRSDHSP